ncbi:MAG: hypothetical protein NT062_29545 [Proteobacteria bacterium]|nr:hypothetical protein [Pseudomonadota bacterium]
MTVNAENLTSHNPEGLATWTDEQIRTALTHGIDDEKKSLYPIMPYPEYSNLTRMDVDSVIQYLRTIPPNDNVVAADFPYFDQSDPAPPVDGTRVPHTTLPSTDPNFAAAERGRYLATVACLNCHTEQVSADVPDLTKAFAGGKKYTFVRGAPEHTSVNLPAGSSATRIPAVRSCWARWWTATSATSRPTSIRCHRSATALFSACPDREADDGPRVARRRLRDASTRACGAADVHGDLRDAVSAGDEVSVQLLSRASGKREE